MSIQVILAILLIALLWLVTRLKSTDKLARFWKKPQYLTKWDIQQKYPKSQTLQQRSIERKRREERAKIEAEAKRKQEIIDRHIRELKKNRLDKPINIEPVIPQEPEICETVANPVTIQTTDRSDSALDNNSQTSSPKIPIKVFEILVKMVNGREDLALRLVRENLRKYPEMPPTWACKKAILDLERYLKIKQISL